MYKCVYGQTLTFSGARRTDNVRAHNDNAKWTVKCSLCTRPCRLYGSMHTVGGWWVFRVDVVVQWRTIRSAYLKVSNKLRINVLWLDIWLGAHSLTLSYIWYVSRHCTLWRTRGEHPHTVYTRTYIRTQKFAYSIYIVYYKYMDGGIKIGCTMMYRWSRHVRKMDRRRDAQYYCNIS